MVPSTKQPQPSRAQRRHEETQPVITTAKDLPSQAHQNFTSSRPPQQIATASLYATSLTHRLVRRERMQHSLTLPDSRPWLARPAARQIGTVTSSVLTEFYPHRLQGVHRA